MILPCVTREVLYVEHLPRHTVGAELGVQDGLNAATLQKVTAPEMLYLVDTFTDTDTQFCEVTAKFAHAENVKVFQATDWEWLATLEDDYLDWVYLDTTHMLDDTRRELAAMRGKVKQGGIVAGHDFCQHMQYGWGTVQAVIESIQDGWLEMVALTTRDAFPTFACKVK